MLLTGCIGRKLNLNDEKHLGSLSFIDNHITDATLLNFLLSPKPPGIGAVDILHVLLLMSRKAEDHEIFDSQQKLAQYFGVDAKTIVRSQKRLEKIGWLVRSRRRGRSNSLVLNYENIPAEEPLRLKITPQAGQLTVSYQIALQKMGRKRFPKHWIAQQKPSAQRILDRCGGCLELAEQIIYHALTSPSHRRKSVKGLYNIVGRWKKIKHTYDLSTEVRRQQKQIAEAQAYLDSQLAEPDTVTSEDDEMEVTV